MPVLLKFLTMEHKLFTASSFPFSICSHYKAQRENPDTRWGLTEDYSVVYSDVQGELTIGGVFLRLFIANPGWVLRKPKEFLTELMEKWTQLITAQNNDVKLKSSIVLYNRIIIPIIWSIY